MKILILKPSSLGDVIHAIPVLRLIKKHRPQSEVYWWLESKLVPLLQNDPDLSGTFLFHRKRWASPYRWPELVASVQEMRLHRFDITIDLQGLARSAMCGWLANPGLCLGLDNPREGAREGARAFYDRVAPRAPDGMHAVERYLAILGLLDVPVHWDFEWLPRRAEAADQVQKKWRPGNDRWMMLLPGARWNNKRWPVERFIELVKLARADSNLRIGILGSGEDKALGKAIAEADPARCLDLTGATTFHEMIEWIRLSRLTVANDTGPMHVAAALRKDVIALFGPTDPQSTGPFGQLHNVIQTSDLPCVPCLRGRCRLGEPLACLRAITPAMVWERAMSILAR